MYTKILMFMLKIEIVLPVSKMLNDFCLLIQTLNDIKMIPIHLIKHIGTSRAKNMTGSEGALHYSCKICICSSSLPLETI